MPSTEVMKGWERAGERYREALGYAPGERLSTPEAIARALEGIAEAHPDRCVLEETGRTYEGRPMHLLTVASPADLKRLDAIREANLALADPEAPEPPEDLPATAWVIANVHGDEHSTAEAALMLAFYLAEADESELSGLVVGIDPLQNPDGRARSVNDYYSLFGLKPRQDANAAEHWEKWGGGRGNHYFFDMNRDWFPLTQPESRARVNAFLRWRPQVLADLHEMWWDSRYFFPPPAVPHNPNLGAHSLRWWDTLGRDLAATFDANGWDYWAREIFDAFYPGYGEAFPTIHGCTGMTFEQASAAGLGVRRKDGTLLEYRDAILHHFGAALSVCRTAAAGRADLIRDARAFFATGREAAQGGPKAYVFPKSGRGSSAERLAALLAAQGITVERLTEDRTLTATPYFGGEAGEHHVPAGSIVVRMDQPEGRAARALLERETAIDPEWLAEQVRRVAEGVEPECYDHTAWSLPLAMGLETLETDTTDLPLEPWSVPPPADEACPGYGFVLPNDGMEALVTAARLIGCGVRVHVARREVTLDGTTYHRGAIVVKRADQDLSCDDLCKAVWEAADEGGARAIPADSSWTEDGISLGSDEVMWLKPPRVAVLYGEPASPLSYGWIAWLLEQRLPLDFTPIRAATLKQADLRLYDVIVLPNGDSDAYGAHLGDGLWTSLREWVRQGGTLVALRGAAKHIAGKGKDWTTARVLNDLRHPEAPPEPEKDRDGKEKEPDVPKEHRPLRIPGAALRARLDRHHWAALGYTETGHVLFDTDILLYPSADGRNVVTLAEEDVVLAGHAWEKMRPALLGKAYLVDEPLGRGHVLLFADDPNQRGYWDVTSRLFVQAVLFAPGAVG